MNYETVDELFSELLSVIQVTLGVVVQGIYQDNNDLIKRNTLVKIDNKIESLIEKSIT
jgi:hypothetical protein